GISAHQPHGGDRTDRGGARHSGFRSHAALTRTPIAGRDPGGGVARRGDHRHGAYGGGDRPSRTLHSAHHRRPPVPVATPGPLPLRPRRPAISYSPLCTPTTPSSPCRASWTHSPRETSRRSASSFHSRSRR